MSWFLWLAACTTPAEEPTEQSSQGTATKSMGAQPIARGSGFIGALAEVEEHVAVSVRRVRQRPDIWMDHAAVADSLLRKGWLLERYDFGRIDEHIGAAEKIAPGQIQIRRLRADWFAASGDFRGAIGALEGLDRPLDSSKKALWFCEMGEIDRGRKLLDKLVKARNASMDWARLAQCRALAGQGAGAIEAWTEARRRVRRSPAAEADAWLGMARAALRAGRIEQAGESVDAARAVFPGWPRTARLEVEVALHTEPLRALRIAEELMNRDDRPEHLALKARALKALHRDTASIRAQASKALLAVAANTPRQVTAAMVEFFVVFDDKNAERLAMQLSKHHPSAEATDLLRRARAVVPR